MGWIVISHRIQMEQVAGKRLGVELGRISEEIGGAENGATKIGEVVGSEEIGSEEIFH